MKRYLMEFLGTCFFVFTIALTFDQFAIAAMLMAWVYIGYFVSGAHYNPAVTLGVALRGRLPWQEVPWYWLAQIAGGFVAFALTGYLHGHTNIPVPGEHVSMLQALVVEVMLAFLFVFTVLAIATSEKYKGNDVFGLVIGLSILALASIGGPISGGLFNPAIALGANLYGLFMGVPISIPHILMYVGGALLGSILAAYAYRYFLAEKHEEVMIFKFY